MPPPPVTGSHNFKFGVGAISAESPCSAAAFVVNSEPHNEARPLVRLCVGPHLMVRVVGWPYGEPWVLFSQKMRGFRCLLRRLLR
jgi:uncharacterized membrane protein